MKKICNVCGQEFEAGSNNIENIVPACLSCNCSKGAREMLSWYTKQSFFSPERLSKIRYYMEEVMM